MLTNIVFPHLNLNFLNVKFVLPQQKYYAARLEQKKIITPGRVMASKPLTQIGVMKIHCHPNGRRKKE